MHDLNELTLITFVKLDNEARIKNLKSMVNYYRNHCENYQHIIVEEDEKPVVPEHLHISTDMLYVFTKNDGEWRKCEGYNKGIKLAKTQYVTFNDVDVIINPLQLLEGVDKLKTPNAGLIYPFNGLFLCVSDEIKDNFCTTLDYNELDKHFPPLVETYDGVDASSAYVHANKTENDILIGHVNSTGGCVMGRRDTLLKCNGYNPNFVGWGYEDDEIPWRINKLGFPCGRISGTKKPAWHLPHFDGTGSKKETQSNYSTNEQLYFKIRNMGRDELTQYTHSWRM